MNDDHAPEAIYDEAERVLKPYIDLIPMQCDSHGRRDVLETADGDEVCGHCHGEGFSGELGVIAVDTVAIEVVGAIWKAMRRAPDPRPAPSSRSDVEAMQRALGFGKTWSARSCLITLTAAVDHMFTVHNCDAHGHEEWQTARNEAAERIKEMDAMLTEAQKEDPRAAADVLQQERQGGEAITVWKDHTWKRWHRLDAKYAEKDPGWMMTIPLDAEGGA